MTTRSAVGHRRRTAAADTALHQLKLNIRSLGDQQRRVAGRLVVLEEVPHLGRGFEIVLSAVELEAFLVGQEGSRLHAQQGVMGLGVAAVGVVAVVGGQEWRADGVCDLDELRVGLDLLRQTVILQFDEEVPLAEDLLEAGGPGQGLLLVTGQEGLEHHASETTGGGDQAFGVLSQQLPVNPRLVVVALEIRRRGELEEVLVALRGLGQKGQVVVELVAAVGVPTPVIDLAPAHRALESGLPGHVGLGPDDGVDPGRATGLVEVEDPVHVAVVSDSERRLAICSRRSHKILDSRCSVQHRVLSVRVEMRE